MHMDDNVEFKGNTCTTRKRWIATILLIIVAFAIGIVIGYFAIKKPESKSEDGEAKSTESPRFDKKAEFQNRQEEISKHHQNFQGSLSEEELRNSLK